MAEGFFHPAKCPVPGLSTDQLSGALVRVLPRTVLHLDWASSAEEARQRARNESRPDGAECWYRYFTREDSQRIRDPQFHMGMVRPEFARHLRSGGSLPAEMPLDGGGTGFAVTAKGHVLTNYRLVTSEGLVEGTRAGALLRRRRMAVRLARRELPGRLKVPHPRR